MISGNAIEGSARASNSSSARERRISSTARNPFSKYCVFLGKALDPVLEPGHCDAKVNAYKQ